MNDFRFALRLLAKHPGFTLVAVLTLALGIGANTAIFSVIENMILTPLPYPHADRLLRLIHHDRKQGQTALMFSGPDFSDFREQNRVFDHLAGFQNRIFEFRGGTRPEDVNVALVTAGYFEIVGVVPILGRTFAQHEQQLGNDHVAILSHEFWERQLSSDREILGKILKFNATSTPYEVIAVMPPGVLHLNGGQADMWIPLPLDMVKDRRARWLSLVGRLKPDTRLDQAQAEMRGIGRRLAEQYPQTNGGWEVQAVPLQRFLLGSVYDSLLILFAAVGFVLLIACANVANLMLVRAVGRNREIAIRVALGASRGRLIRLVITESMLLALLGTTAGILVQSCGLSALTAMLPGVLVNPIEMNVRVVAFALAATILTALLVGILPVLHGTRLDLRDAFMASGSGGHTTLRFRKLSEPLIVIEVALAFILLVGAGLLMKSFLTMNSIYLGFDASNVLTLRIKPNWTAMPRGRPTAAFYHELFQGLRKMPAIQRVGANAHLPMTTRRGGIHIDAEGAPPEVNARILSVGVNVVIGDYFHALRIPLLRGRFFTELDQEDSAPVVILSEHLSRTFWPKQDPIGKQVSIRGKQHVVVGIVGDLRDSYDYDAAPKFYVPLLQQLNALNAIVLVIRTDADPLSLIGAVSREVLSGDAGTIVSDVRTMEQIRTGFLSTRRFLVLLLGLFAGAALLLAAAGVYGVNSFAVQRRTQEIGVRMAIGAQPRDVIRLVMAKSLGLVVIGLSFGSLGALAVTRILSSMLYGVAPTDPATFAGVAMLLIAVTMLSCYLPARRATRVDPMAALRYGG